jgi:hypothetical protein
MILPAICASIYFLDFPIYFPKKPMIFIVPLLISFPSEIGTQTPSLWGTCIPPEGQPPRRALLSGGHRQQNGNEVRLTLGFADRQRIGLFRENWNRKAPYGPYLIGTSIVFDVPKQTNPLKMAPKQKTRPWANPGTCNLKLVNYNHKWVEIRNLELIINQWCLQKGKDTLGRFAFSILQSVYIQRSSLRSKSTFNGSTQERQLAALEKNELIRSDVTIWFWLTVFHGKIHPFSIGKPSISMGHLYHGYVK